MRWNLFLAYLVRGVIQWVPNFTDSSKCATLSVVHLGYASFIFSFFTIITVVFVFCFVITAVVCFSEGSGVDSVKRFCT